MPISHNEDLALTCPACGNQFRAEVWLILDAAEQPAQVEALRQHRLNMVTCPHCGATGPAGAPLLLHDGAARQVIFAPTPGVPEHRWRDQAYELHALLVGSIPLDERRAYLGDVRITQDLADVAHLLNKAARRREAEQNGATVAPVGIPIVAPVQPTATIPEPQPAPRPDPDDARLQVAIEQLLMASSEEDVHTIVRQYPVLATAEAPHALQQLADVAFNQREYELAESLRQARHMLVAIVSNASSGAPVAPPSVPTDAQTDAPPTTSAAPTADADPPPAQPPELVSALLQVEDAAALDDLVAAWPALLEPGTDAALEAAVNQFLDEGHERLAAQLELQRERLAELRSARLAAPAPAGQANQPPAPAGLDATQDAIEALLFAEDEDELAQVLIAHPVLLTDEAQAALWALSSEARAGGDTELASYAVECRAMLRRVRDELAPAE